MLIAGGISFEATRAKALAAQRQRAEILPAFGDLPGSDWGEVPQGHREAFEAGARPPWPGPRAAPDLAVRWNDLRRRAASGGITPQPGVDHRQRAQFPGSSNSGTLGIGRSRWETSPNWAGAVLPASSGERFSAVTARWRIPNAMEAPRGPLPIASADPAEPPSRRASVWIGLDGHRAIAGSLPQIGTTTAEIFPAEGRRVEAYAWAQWWVRGEQYGEMVFQNFLVQPGDEVTCWLAMHDGDHVVMCILNHRTSQEDAVRWSGPPVDAMAANLNDDEMEAHQHRPRRQVKGMAAVWVVERPTVMGRDDLFPIPALDPVEFTDCIAGVRGQGDPYREVADLRDLKDSRMLRMFDQCPAPWRARSIVTPAPIGADRTRLLVNCRG